MAVRATHLTFREFRFNRPPRVPAASKKPDSLPFERAIDMIELEHGRVRLAAVNTRVMPDIVG